MQVFVLQGYEMVHYGCCIMVVLELVGLVCIDLPDLEVQLKLLVY
jgi:hypothetical protein